MSDIHGIGAAVSARWRGFESTSAGGGKVVSLDRAVRAHVRPGDTLYFGGSMARPNAAMFEVLRAFWRKKPEFVLAAPAVANQHAPLIRAGLVSKVISSIHAMTFPTPAPHPIYVDVDRSGAVAFENWSLLTLTQRLMAAALGLPFMPTRSLQGSDMAVALEAAGALAGLKSPFSDQTATVVAPLAPDVTFVHALAADADGNTLICPPLYDGPWAAFAASRAVIVTVERIVNQDFIRRHAEHVKLPGSAVTAVCCVPMGGHPNSLPSSAIPELGGYPDDYGFLETLREAGRSAESLDRWIEEWILDCPDHAAYLAKLGGPRIHELRGRALDNGWMFDVHELFGDVRHPAPTETERHAILAARVLKDRLATGEIDCILAGLGISSLAAWMAAMRLMESGKSVPLMVEAGMYGYVPAPMDPFLFNYQNMAGSSMLSDVVTTLGVLTAGPKNRSIGVLGAAQIDRDGNLNTSRVKNQMLTGSGGANDIGTGASEVLVTIAHSPKRLVRKVDFVTTPGHSVRTIVTPLAVFERAGSGEFQLVRVLANGDRPVEDLVTEARARSDWSFSVADDLILESEPSADEIAFGRQLDPRGTFLG